MLSLGDLVWPRRTARLGLRPMRFDDLSSIWTWYSRPEVSEWLSWRSPDEAAFVGSLEFRLDEFLSVEFDGRVAGTGKVTVQDGWAQQEVAEQARRTEAEIGWTLDPSLHGRGLGTELARELLAIAFDGLGVRRVVALCFADNVASWKVMEKVGMRREAHYIAESLHRSGRYLDGMTYAMLADEWRAGER